MNANRKLQVRTGKSGRRLAGPDRGAKLPDNAGEDSVSILPDLLGTANGPVCEATIHQAPNRDLALRQGA